jgi:PEP-CTERM motif
MRSIAFLVLWSFLLVVPASADDIYDNGPTNGTTNAWEINFGHIVSESFTVGSGGATITGLSFSAWLLPGDVLDGGVEVSITSAEFGGTTFVDERVNFTQSGCSINQLDFDVCTETGSLSPVDLAGGTYWLNLQNAQVKTNEPIYWDENSGPSQASENSVGTIPSESFTLLGRSGTGTTPEPSSILLFGSGMMGLIGVLCRRWR